MALTSSMATFLVHAGFDPDDITAYPEVSEELFDIADGIDWLLVEVNFVVKILQGGDDGLVFDEAVGWVLGHSVYLEAVPIFYLKKKGYLRGRTDVTLAADAYMAEQRPASRLAETHPTEATNVIPIEAARAKRRGNR